MTEQVRVDFGTNISRVAADVEKGLGRVAGAVKGTQSKLAASDVTGQLMRGVTSQLSQITANFGKAMNQVASGMETSILQAGPGGKVAGAPNLRKLTRAPLEELEAKLAGVSKQVEVALQGATGVEADKVRGAVARGTEQVRLGVAQMYTDIATSLNKLRMHGPEGYQGKWTRVTGASIPGSLDDSLLNRLTRAAVPPKITPTSPAVAKHARAELVHASLPNTIKREREKHARKVENVLDKSTQAAEQEARAAEKVVRDLERNRTAMGGFHDTGKARIKGGIITDAEGRRWTETEHGVKPYKEPEHPVGKFKDETRVLAEEENRLRSEANRRLQAQARVEKEIEEAAHKENKLRNAQIAERESIQVGKELRTGDRRRAIEGRGEGGTYARVGEGDDAKYYKRVTRDNQIHYERIAQSAAAQQTLAKAKEATDRASLKAARIEQKAREQNAAAQAGGGGGPRSGRVLNTLFGEGPNGRGGGLFTGQRLLRQGASFGGYMISAAAIGGTIAALAQAKEAVLDYRDSLTDLEVALSNTDHASSRFIAGLSDTAREAGANTGDAIDAAVRGIRAFGSGAGDQEGIGAATAEAASHLAVIAEKDLKDATGDIIAISSAFNMAAHELSQINDAIAVAKRELGGDSKQIAQGLATVGVAASEVGFTLQETANLISLVQARTDQSGQAVGTRLSKVFSIIGGSAGKSGIQRLNRELAEGQKVDTTAPVRDQLMQLSELYSTLNSQQQGLIRNALGGAANTRELLPILQEPERLAEALGAQYEGAGAGIDEFRRKANDLAGTLKKLRGDIEGIMTGLFEAGVFDIFGIALKTIEPFANALRTVVNIYNKMFGLLGPIGDKMQTLVMLTLQYVAATKALNIAQGQGYLTNVGTRFAGGMDALARRGIFRSPGAIARAGEGAYIARDAREALAAARRRVTSPGRMFGGSTTGAMGPGSFTAFNAGSAAAAKFSTAITGVKTSLASAAVSGRRFLNANPLLVVVGGLLAIHKALMVTRGIIEEVNLASDMIGRRPETLNAQGLRDVASDASSQAQRLRDSSRGFWGWLSNNIVAGAMGQGDQTGKAASILEARAREARRRADELEQIQRESARGGRPSDAIDVTTPEGISEGLKTLDESGRNAITTFDALREAFRGLATDGAAAASALSDMQQRQMGNLIGDAVQAALGQEEDIFRGLAGQPKFDPFSYRDDGGRKGQRDAAEWIRDLLEREDFAPGVDEVVQQAIRDTGGDLSTGENRKYVSDQIARYLQQQQGYTDWAESNPEMAQEFLDRMLLPVIESVNDFQKALDPQAAIDAYLREGIGRAQTSAALKGRIASLSGGRGSMVEIQEHIAGLKALRADVLGKEAEPGQIEQLDAELAGLELELQKALTAHIDAQAKLAQTLLPGTEAVGRHRLSIQAIRDKLKVVTDRDEIDELRGQLREAEREELKLLAAQAGARRLAGVAIGDEVGVATAQARNAYDQLRLIINDGDTSSQAYWDARRAYGEALQAQAEAEVARANAHRLEHVDPRNQLQSLTAQIQNTLAELAITNPNSTKASTLRKQLRDLQLQEQRKVLSTANAARIAAIDPRATTHVARINLDNARANLAIEIEGTEEYYQALLAVRQAELALAEAHRALADAERMATIDPRSTLQTATAQLESARDNLAGQLEGSQGWWEALGRLRDAQQALAEAEIEAAHNARLVGIDLSDPVAVAEAELANVRARIAQARASGASQDVIDPLLIQEEQAQNSAEMAAFQQRMRDAQVAKDLGRMSHAAYLSYLESEASRLRAISNRTRQQQEMLNQVELAIKASQEELSGMFNLGDIRVPTPFEVRRAIAAQTAGVPGVGGDGAALIGQLPSQSTSVTNQITNHITIDGADFDRVVRYLEDTLGRSAVARRSSSSGRRI